MERVSIIIPAYNEEKRIERTLSEYGKFFKKLKKDKKIDFEILAVLNACKDNTLGVVKEKQKRFKEIRYLNFERGGKGFAITEGFKDALTRKNNLIGFVDADNATGPEAYYGLIKELGKYHGIIASRYVKGSIVRPRQTIQRIFLSRLGNFIIRSLLFIPYRDTQCGAKLFKRMAIEETLSHLKFSRWAFDVDLLYNINKKGFKIKEASTVWSDQSESRIIFAKTGPMFFLAVIRLRILNSIFKKFIKIYDKIISKIVLKDIK